MAAITETVIVLAEAGANIITSPFLFGNTCSLFEKTLKRWGLETRYADMTKPESIKSLIDDKTRLIFLEVITNPQLEVADIAKVTAIAAELNLPVVLDGTLTTPFLFKSKDSGVAVEIISSTKYITGGATSIGGLIIDNGVFNWKKNKNIADEALKSGPGALLVLLRREVHRNCGSCMSPHTAWLQTLGLETLALRIERSSTNAFAVAEFLTAAEKIHSVNYPGLSNSVSFKIAKRQFKNGCGGLLTFELNSKEECFKFMDSLAMIRRATNINDNKTLIIHPASTIFCDYSEDERNKMLVNDRLIRLSVGIEDKEDIIADLQKGLDAL
jgi:O-acetylhomoserine (thiol)-lyase